MPRRSVTARLRYLAALVAACALVVPVSPALSAETAPPGDAFTVTADRIEYNSVTRVARADGHARATARDAVITADHLEANMEAQEVLASGNVALSQGAKTLTGSLLRYNLRTRVGRFEQAAGQLGVWHVTGETIDVAPQEDVVAGASITPCDPDHPLYKVTAKKIVIVPDQYFTAYNASLWVAGVRVITLPVYTASARGRSGPSLGYDTLDGAYIEYANSFLVGGWRDEYRIRLATSTGLSAENTISQRFGDHIWSVDLGRSAVKDVNGNRFNLDRYSLDLVYDRERIPGWPLDVAVEAHAGSYGELATGVTTTRAEAIVTFATDTFTLSPTLYFSAAGRIHYDVYGSGQQRTVVEGSTALSSTLSPRASASLSYNLIAVNGSSPFLFDHFDPSSSATLYYNYAFGGFVQNVGASVTYGFLSMQTTLGLSASFRINANTAFNISAQYNLTTQQVTEIDYALNVRCDCVTVNLVYQTFPQNPAGNMLTVVVELNTLSGGNVTF